MNSSDEDNALSRRSRDFDDQQNELAGRETGRQRRFLPDDALSPEGRKKKAERERFSELMRMLADPAYRALYEQAAQRLSEAEQATDRALDRIGREISAARDQVSEIEDRAARLPDGTRVYRAADGTIRREDGSIVEGPNAESIVWRGDEPCYEEMQAARERLEVLHRAQQDLLDYQNGVLGPARDRLEDEDNPPTPDELRDILGRIRNGAPRHLASESLGADAPERSEDRLRKIMVPDLGGI